jgi:cytoskeletal protein RodZ
MASLYQDLLKIRIQAGLKPYDIYERTRIPLDVIVEIEKGTINNNKQYQVTYLRSYVRSYAKSLGINDQDIITALDADASGSYTGSIAKLYLGESQSDLSGSINPVDHDEEILAADAVKAQAAGANPPSFNDVDKTGYSRPDSSKPHNLKTPSPPELQSVDWADMSRQLGSMQSFPYRSVITVIFLLAAGAAGYYYWSNLYQKDTETQPLQIQEQVHNTEPIAPAAGATTSTQVAPVQPATANQIDTMPASVVPVSPPTNEQITSNTQQSRTVSPGTLPDTLFITVHAAFDRLEPVRVTSDVNNTRSPYWVESNEAMRFDFLDNILIEGQLSRMAIWINGHLMEDFMEYSTSSRIIELSRDILAGYPHFFNTDSTGQNSNVQRPRAIHNRPIF